MNPNLAIQLARSCAYSAQAPEWEEFVRVVMPIVALSARRVCNVWGESSPATVAEIVQDVFLKLCEDERRILREFEDRGNHSFLKLLRTITVSVGTDFFRRNHAEKRGGRSLPVPAEPQLSFEEVSDEKATLAVEWPTLVSQLDNLLILHARTVSARDRNLFWLYFRQGMTAEAIARIPAIGLTAKGVESALTRLTKLLRETIIHGKPVLQFEVEKLPLRSSGKGFHQVIAIDSVKRR